MEQGVGRRIKRCFVELSGPFSLPSSRRDVILQTNAYGPIPLTRSADAQFQYVFIYCLLM